MYVNKLLANSFGQICFPWPTKTFKQDFDAFPFYFNIQSSKKNASILESRCVRDQ